MMTGVRVLVAGATGVLGRPILAALRGAGHEAAGIARRGDGAEVHAADALDRAAVAAIVAAVRPDAVINVLSAIPARVNTKRLERDFALTNRLRNEGTGNLLAAAPGARHLAQSIAFVYDPAPGLADEDDPTWAPPPREFVTVLGAVLDLERQTRAAGGVVLRLGQLHGPGTAFAPGGSFAEAVRARRIPLVGRGTAVSSFLHVEDAASAFVAGLGAEGGGTFNVCEDAPPTVAEWLPAYARALGARPPRRVPVAVARIAAGDYGAAFFTRLRGASNARARERLGWAPKHRFPGAPG